MSVPDLARPPSVALGRIDRLTDVPADLVDEFLPIYRAAFAPLEVLAPGRQGLTDDEFRQEMSDPRVTKLVGRDAAGEAATLAFVATDLSLMPWISVPYYAARYPEHYARGAIFYVGALLVRPERQGGPWVKVIVDELLRYVAENRAVMAFDCCGFNTDVVKLPETVARATHRIAYADTVELDSQRYYAYVMDGLR